MSPKEDPKKDEATVSVNVDEFAKTRDSVSFLMLFFFFLSRVWGGLASYASVNSSPGSLFLFILF